MTSCLVDSDSGLVRVLGCGPSVSLSMGRISRITLGPPPGPVVCFVHMEPIRRMVSLSLSFSPHVYVGRNSWRCKCDWRWWSEVVEWGDGVSVIMAVFFSTGCLNRGCYLPGFSHTEIMLEVFLLCINTSPWQSTIHLLYDGNFFSLLWTNCFSQGKQYSIISSGESSGELFFYCAEAVRRTAATCC